MKNAPISISTYDGSTSENEDVAELKAEGSNSWLVAQREDNAKGYVVNRGSDIKRSSDDATGGFKERGNRAFQVVNLALESCRIEIPCKHRM